MNRFINVGLIVCTMLGGTSRVEDERAPEPPAERSTVWSAEKAQSWSEQKGWLVGCNFIPSTAINQLEMWQADAFENLLPFMKERQIGAHSWGFVSGKTQTIYPWDSWRNRYDAEPELWFHDIFNPNGSPYSNDRSFSSNR